MSLELTSVYQNINNIKRNLFYNEGTTLKFMRQNEVLLELEEGFFIQKDPTSSVADKALGSGGKGSEEFFECSVALDDDGIDLVTIIELTTTVNVGEEVFKISQYVKPRTSLATRKWTLRLTTYGKK